MFFTLSQKTFNLVAVAGGSQRRFLPAATFLRIGTARGKAAAFLCARVREIYSHLGFTG